MQTMFLEHRLLFVVIFAASTMSMVNWSCSSRSTAPDSSASYNLSTPQESPSPTPNEQSGSIRGVDFRNFVYPWYPSFLKSSSREVTLHDGKLEIDEDRKAGIANLSLNLEDVSYVSLRDRGKEEAIVAISGITGVNRFVSGIFIYSIEENQPKLLWQHETGDRAEGGVRRVAVDNGILTVEEYARSEGDGGLCCPRIFVRSEYKWTGDRFDKVKSETLQNEYKTAEFLGYPGSRED